MTKKVVKFISLILTLQGCIPLSFAPSIESYELIATKKFSKELPSGYGFVFEDPKSANEFYYYINSKFDLNFSEEEFNIPVELNGKALYLSFYECERTTKTINLIPILLDAKREDNGNEPIFQDQHSTRNGHWYIVITVRDAALKDLLHPENEQVIEVSEFLESLRKEYLSTYHYNELILIGDN